MFRLDRLYKRRLAQAARSADVNIVDEIDQPEGLELSEPSTFPAGEQPSKQTLFHPTKQLQQPRSVMRAPRAEFGVNLDELAAPSVGGIGTDNPADNHQSENDFEDPDLKMGQVEEPYSMSSGPMNTRFDDDKKYDIVKGARAIVAIDPRDTISLKLSPEEQIRWDEEEEHWSHGNGPPMDASHSWPPMWTHGDVYDQGVYHININTAHYLYDVGFKTFSRLSASPVNVGYMPVDTVARLTYNNDGTATVAPFISRSDVSASDYEQGQPAPQFYVDALEKFLASGGRESIRVPNEITASKVAAISDAMSYATNELKLSPDVVADNLITQIEGIRDQLVSLDVPSVRKSIPVANVRHGPNVFTFTVVIDARWGGESTIVLDADVALNGTGRSNASFNIPADVSGLDGIIELWDLADTVWNDLVSAIEANLYWLDTEVGSVDMPKEGVGLIEGPAMDENIHGNDFGRLDQAIPRDPAKEDLLYPR